MTSTPTPDQLAAAMYYYLATGHRPQKWKLSRVETEKQFASVFPGMMQKPRTKKTKR